MTALAEYVPALGVVLELLIAWALWSVRQEAKSTVTKYREEMDPQIGDLQGRTAKLEVLFETLPSVKEVRVMTKELADLAGDVKALTAEVRASRENTMQVQKSIDRINDYMLEHK